MQSYIAQELQQLIAKQESLLKNLNIIEQKLQFSENKQWNQREHRQFIQGINLYGKTKQKEVAQYIQTKNNKQVSSHSQKFFGKLQMWFSINIKTNYMIPYAEYHFKQLGLNEQIVNTLILEFSCKNNELQ
ncbi:Myb-like_DNA-binding domain-containing protein [Hexamita inflata]|uniref:Myb-like DNA-binding domain-containing protein n=1 Tax=Hexamita inflata TaxID=28002 RepID=A0AA86NQS4_9EUKA|nr:Myb-like DNA-binding domain-containing protein [Hexamita inflata]